MCICFCAKEYLYLYIVHFINHVLTVYCKRDGIILNKIPNRNSPSPDDTIASFTESNILLVDH